MKIYSVSTKRFCIIAVGVLLFFFGLGVSPKAHADELITLVTNKPVYVNGETVILTWYINTTVQNCTITGPGLTLPVTPAVITAADLPVTGTYSYIPPDDSAVSFNLNCEKYTPVTVVPVVPSVTVYLDWQNNNITKYLDDGTGAVPSTYVSWTSSNATRCSDVIYRNASTGNIWTTVNIAGDEDYNNRRGTSGWVRFDGDPRLISETTEFAVGCYNDNEDPVTSRWNTKQLTVSAIPSEPPPVAVSLWSPNYPRVTADMLNGYATATVWWSVAHADGCTESAQRMDGTSISVPGWDFGSTQFSGNRLTSLATTTKFILTCWRNQRQYNDTIYLATSTTKELIIEVENPYGGMMGEWDRSDPQVVPPVTVSATATPNPTYKDALTGYAVTSVGIEAHNASYCYLYAYADNDGDGNYTNLYTLSGWTRTSVNNRLSGNYIGSIQVKLNRSTRLYIDCIREYDLLYGTGAEQDNGREQFSVTVEVLPPDEPAPDPQVYLYGNAVREYANSMWSKKTSVSGYTGVTGSDPYSYLRGTPGAGLVNRISFPFDHPYDEANAYDVWLDHCDNVVPDGRIGISLTSDDVDYVYFNGSYLGSSNNWQTLSYYTPPLREGLNVIAVKVNDTGGHAGLLAALKWSGGSIVTGADWKVSTVPQVDWNSMVFDDSGWSNATTHGSYGVYPWYWNISGFPGGTGAQWIWTPNYYNGDRELYLRYSFYVDADDLAGDGATRTYRLYDGEGNLVGTHDEPGVIAAVSCTGKNFKRDRIASSVVIHDQDAITLECESGSATDNCPTERLYFGAGNNSTIVARMNPVTELATVQMLWLSQNTTSCYSKNAYDPITGAYKYQWDSSSAVAGFPVPLNISTSTKFTVTCNRPADGLTASSQVTVNVPFKSIYNITTLVFSGECIDDGTFGHFGEVIDAPEGYGPSDPDGYCTPMVDLAAVSPATSLAGAVEDNVNGTYDDLDALVVIQNLGPGGLPVDSGIAYKAILTPMAVFGLLDIETAIGTFNGELLPPDGSGPTQSPTLTREFDGVPFGTHTVCARVNLDGSPNFPEAAANLSNNSSCATVTLPVPRPPMTIDTDRDLIRAQQSVEVNWGVNVTYQLLCTVRGPSGLNESFDTLVVGPGYTSSFTTAALSSTVEFELQCTEPITNTVFTERKRVEMVPDVEEI